ncbi:MAG: hypothetical protein WKF66_15510 [Pedobacter sp.]
MKTLLLITGILMGMVTKDQPKIDTVRSLFYQAAKDKTSAKKFLNALSVVDNNSSPVLVCYKGVAEMMQAKHVLSPFSKLQKFKTGKTLIEKSIKRDPNDLELRFLRFSIQSNLPEFLGYDQAISADKVKLINGYSSIKDDELRQCVVNYLTASKYCTVAELKKIKR